jgi:hypothetical protein
LGTPEAIFDAEKSGQFLVRTHVRKNQQNLNKSRGMSGVLKLSKIVVFQHLAKSANLRIGT